MSKLQICLTHDVDRLHKTYQYLTHDLRRLRFKRLKNLLSKKNPYWMLNEMADLEEKYGVRSTLFFLNESLTFSLLKPKEWKLSLGRYSIQEKKIAERIREFYKNGWEIGVHGSYNSYTSLELLRNEKRILEDIVGAEILGVRQHYLNLLEPETWSCQRKAGFKYDASLGKKRGVGYIDKRRKPFTDETSGMFIIPLTIMDCNLFSQANNDPTNALEIAIFYMNEAERNGEVFTILWHQRMFNKEEFPGYISVYKNIIEEGKQRNAAFMTSGELYYREKLNVKI